MSVNAKVTGPAAIFGSSLSACRSAGTVNPKKHAAHSASEMLPPIAKAARPVPRQSQTISPTTVPQAAPPCLPHGETPGHTSRMSAASRAMPES